MAAPPTFRQLPLSMPTAIALASPAPRSRSSPSSRGSLRLRRVATREYSSPLDSTAQSTNTLNRNAKPRTHSRPLSSTSAPYIHALMRCMGYAVLITACFNLPPEASASELGDLLVQTTRLDTVNPMGELMDRSNGYKAVSEEFLARRGSRPATTGI